MKTARLAGACAALACAALAADTAFADGYTFQQNQSLDDQTYRIDVGVTYSQIGRPPRNLNSGVGTFKVSLPGSRAQLDTANPAEPAGYTCSVTNSAYGESATGFLCSTDGQAVEQGFAFPTSATVHLVSPDCYTAPDGSSAQPAIVEVWSLGYDPGVAPDVSYTLANDKPCAADPGGQPVLEPKPLQCIVPNLKNLSLAAATRQLKNRRCARGSVRFAKSKRIKKGRVISQSRRPGTKLKAGSKISLVVARQP